MARRRIRSSTRTTKEKADLKKVAEKIKDKTFMISYEEKEEKKVINLDERNKPISLNQEVDEIQAAINNIKNC